MFVVGRPVTIRGAYEIVTGKAKYTADAALQTVLYARLLQSPHPHAIVEGINVEKARKLPSVKAIITAKDVPKIFFYPHETRPLLPLDTHLRCIGDPVAVVAAESMEAADEALKLIDVKYRLLQPIVSVDDAIKPDSPKIHPDGNIANEGGVPLTIEWGNVKDAYKESQIIVEGEFKTQRQVPTPIEPRACIAYWDGEVLTAWVSTQWPHRVREDISRVLNLPLSKVRVISHFVGGGFGGKKQENYSVIAALLAMKVPGRAIKLVYTRQQEHLIGRSRYSSDVHFKLGVKEDGTFNAFEFEAVYNVGAYGSPVGGSLNLLVSELYMYKSPNAKFKATDVNTNLITAQPFRGVQMPSYHFAVEQIIDQAAEQLGMDPIEIRLKNTYRYGDKMPPYNATLSVFAIEECMERALEMSRWKEKWRGWKRPVEIRGSKRIGIGLATSMGWCEWMREHTAAVVKVDPDGSATLFTGCQDIGTGCKTTLCQIVAEELGLSYEEVNLVHGDTSLTPEDFGTCASRTLYVGGFAAQQAAKDAKRNIFKLAAPILDVKPDELELRNKRVYVRDKPEKGILLPELLRSTVTGSYYPKPVRTVAPLREAVYVGGAVVHIAEVEVDIETGEVKVLRYVAAHDVGKAINPVIVENQIYGAVIQGIGYALTENLQYNKSGNCITPDYMDYKIPGILDIPEIIPILVEVGGGLFGPFMAKGIGEHAINPVAGAIANAVYNAIGVRIKELPMTPENILLRLTSKRYNYESPY
jgi:xanthine dehydrogenase molybdenum-binding subunit